MKARVKASGEIVEIEQLTRTTAICPANGKIYHKSQLDLDPDPSHPEATISGWVAREEGGGLYLHSLRPRKGAMEWRGDRQPLTLPLDSFSSLTWQDEPIEVEITIKPKK